MTDTDVIFGEVYFADPYAFYAELRKSGPLHRFRAPVGTSGISGWLVTSDELAREVLTHPDIGKSPETMFGGTGASGSRRLALTSRASRAAAAYLVTHMLGADPPDHARLRRTVSHAFTPRAVCDLAPRIEELTRRLLDTMNPAAPVDLVSSLAFPLPVQVISDIVGIPSHHRERIGRCSHVLSDVIVAEPNQLRSAAMDFARLILPYLYQRRLRPRADLLTSLAKQTRRGEIDTKEALSTVALLLIAGHETTSNLIINTVLALLDNPAELDRVRNEPDRIDAVIEETLRTEPPVPATTLRETRADIELDGRRINVGELIMVSLLAANRDEQAVEKPDVFDVDRHQSHLAFGYGAHRCLGTHLARLEARIALTELFARYPHMALAIPTCELRWRESIVFRRMEQLPVKLHP